MGGLNLSDLGIGPVEPDQDPRQDLGRGKREDDTVAVTLDDGLVTLRDVATRTSGISLADIIADLGVKVASRIIRDAVNQIWGAAPNEMPFHALVGAVALEEQDAPRCVEALEAVLSTRLPDHTVDRILVLIDRRAHAFFDTYPGWQARLADEGAEYQEMERRALTGEFDASGPLPSRFNLTTMAFPDE